MATVRQMFLSPVEVTLIEQCFLSIGALADKTINVQELGRYGKSGARLLLCYPPSGLPFVVKIHREAKIKVEADAIASVADCFRDALPLAHPAYYDGLGALLYNHHGASTARKSGESRELRDLVYEYDPSKRAFKHPEEKLISALQRVWYSCEVARDCAQPCSFNYLEEYDWYIRRDTASGPIASMLGRKREQPEFRFLGGEVVNPLDFINQPFFTSPRLGKVGPVHGDLHANNIIVGFDDSVHLIDFAWAAQKRHVLVDYALMENSLRFLLFPDFVDPSEQLEVDLVLLRPDGALDLAKWPESSRLAPYYRRLGALIRVIRDQAQAILGGNGEREFQEYLAAQFLILFGQMSYRDYNRLIALRFLGLLARRLSLQGFATTG